MISQEKYLEAKKTIEQYESEQKQLLKANDFEEKAWEIIAELGWGTKTTDYKALREKLKSEYSDSIDKLEDFIRVKCNLLSQKLDKLYKNDDIELGDDCYGDMIAHIVGLGKEEYNKVMANPKHAIKRAEDYDFEESFTYILP